MPHHMVEIADILLSPLKGRMCLGKKELHGPRLFILSVCLAKIIFVNLFYYSTYFYYYLWALLHFLELFMGSIVLFQLTFSFIYSSFNKKFSIATK